MCKKCTIINFISTTRNVSSLSNNFFISVSSSCITYTAYSTISSRTDGGVGGVGYTAAGYTDEEIVRKRTYISGGTYKIDNSAFFAQGSFQLTDRWLLNAGLRSDSFDNGNAAGKSFIALEL